MGLGLKVPPSLRYRKYALLWGGLLVSTAGSQMQIWALYWHLRTLSDQPAAVSIVGAVRFVPILIFALFGGLVADRYNRRLVLMITQTVMLLVAFALALLTWLGTIQLWHIYALTAVQAIAMSFDLPARQALIPNLLPRAVLPNAFSMNSIAGSIGSIVGPALSGLVIASLGQGYTYFFNAISFLAVLAAVVAMGPVVQELGAGARPEPGFKAIGDGVRFILSRPVIFSSMVLDFFATFFSSANTLLPFVARDVLHVSELEYGWLAAAQSVGSVTAGVILSQRSRIHRQGATLLAAVGVFGLATIIFGMAQIFWLTFAALIFVGAADTVSTIIRNTVRQLQTPDAMRGRMTSINQIFFQGGPQLGEIEAGLVAQGFGVPAAIITGGIGCIVASGVIARVWPQLRKYDMEEEAAR
jgi:MFS family permease